MVVEQRANFSGKANYALVAKIVKFQQKLVHCVNLGLVSLDENKDWFSLLLVALPKLLYR